MDGSVCIQGLGNEHFFPAEGEGEGETSVLCITGWHLAWEGGFQPQHTSEATLGANRQLCSLASHPHPHLSLKLGSLAFLQNLKHWLFPWINLVTNYPSHPLA